MKKLLIGLMMLLTLTSCNLKSEKIQYLEQCEKLYFCKEWKDDTDTTKYSDEQLLDVLNDKLYYYGDSAEEVKQSINSSKDLQKELDDLFNSLEKMEYLLPILLQTDYENYNIDITPTLRGYRIYLEDIGTDASKKLRSEEVAEIQMFELIEKLYYEFNYYFEEEFEMTAKTHVIEAYEETELLYNVIGLLEDGSIITHSERQYAYTEKIVTEMTEELNIIGDVYLGLYGNSDVFTENLHIEGSIYEIVVTDNQNAVTKALETYSMIEDYVNNNDVEVGSISLYIQVVNEDFVQTINVTNLSVESNVGFIFVSTWDQVENSFSDALKANHIDQTNRFSGSLKYEYITGNQINVVIDAWESETAYSSVESLNAYVNSMIEDITLEFEQEGFDVHSVTYEFDYLVEIDGVIKRVNSKHVVSENTTENVNWIDNYTIQDIEK